MANDSLQVLCQNLTTSFVQHFNDLLFYDLETRAKSSTNIMIIDSTLDIIRVFINAQPHTELSNTMMKDSLPQIYLLGNLVPKFLDFDAQIAVTARDLWIFYMTATQDKSRQAVLSNLKTCMCRILSNSSVIPT